MHWRHAKRRLAEVDFGQRRENGFSLAHRFPLSQQACKFFWRQRATQFLGDDIVQPLEANLSSPSAPCKDCFAGAKQSRGIGAASMQQGNQRKSIEQSPHHRSRP